MSEPEFTGLENRQNNGQLFEPGFTGLENGQNYEATNGLTVG